RGPRRRGPRERQAPGAREGRRAADDTPPLLPGPAPPVRRVALRERAPPRPEPARDLGSAQAQGAEGELEAARVPARRGRARPPRERPPRCALPAEELPKDRLRLAPRDGREDGRAPLARGRALPSARPADRPRSGRRQEAPRRRSSRRDLSRG